MWSSLRRRTRHATISWQVYLQDSFYSAGMDCLPTPLNLRRCGYRVNSTCLLCGSSQPTTPHILNVCLEALNQGHFTWHHDSVSILFKYNHVIKYHLRQPSLQICQVIGLVIILRQPSQLTCLSHQHALTWFWEREEHYVFWSSLWALTLSVVLTKLDLENSTSHHTVSACIIIILRLEVILATLENGALGHHKSQAIKTCQIMVPDVSRKFAKQSGHFTFVI